MRQYLHQKLGMTYKMIKPITVNHNFLLNKLKRQFAAAQYIEMMFQKKTIINIDESVFSETDSRHRGWWYPYMKNQNTRTSRLASINLICAISNKGQLFFTINSGRTNSDTFFFFIMKLIEQLQQKSKTWRQNTIFLLDNAKYHKSK